MPNFQLVEYKNDIVRLCALGHTDREIADELKNLGISRVTADEVKRFRRSCGADIVKYAELESESIIAHCTRVKKPYRLAELNALTGRLREAIDDMLDEDPVGAARIMQTYLKAMQQLDSDANDVSRRERSNQLIVILNQATPEQKTLIVNHLIELEKLQKEVEAGGLPATNVVEGEFTVADVNQSE